jgi:hypothetical protein
MTFRRFLLSGFVLVFLIFATGDLMAAEKSPYQEAPQSCAGCHIIKPYVESWKNSDFLAHKHEQAKIACAECHQLNAKQKSQNIAAFKNRKYKSPLDEREYGNDLCFRCHGSYQEVRERTKDFKDKGLLRNPHESHYGDMDCNMCHKIHRTSIDYCSQCHETGVNKPGWKKS